MDDSQPAQAGAADAADGTAPLLTFEQLAADPEIAPLLEFEPVARQLQKANGWTAAMQRMFIGWLAHYGSPGKAADELGKARSGIDKVYKAAGADSFRAAWDGAVALAERRMADALASSRSGAGAMSAPFMARRKHASDSPAPGPGEVRNERGEYEDQESLRRRGEEARDSISAKLLRCRRLYLQEISGSPGKRAAFEILTTYPIDWDRAARLEAQDDEPWRKPNMHRPDMLLTAENGWMGDIVHGEDKKRELRRAMDRHRAEEGKPPIDWDSDSTDQPPP